jgi:hypothetical protein
MVKRHWAAPENLFPSAKRFKLEQEGNKLKITAYWSEWLIPLLVGPFLFGLQMLALIIPFVFFYFPERGSISYFLFLIVIFGLGLTVGYTALVLWVNKTVLNISPEEIEVMAGPLPWPIPQPQQFNPRTIHQLRVVNKLLGHELQAIDGQGRQKVVLLRMLSQAAAFYLEEEMSDYLGLPLPDRPVPLPNGYKEEAWSEIYHFAKRYALRFRISKFTAAPILFGLYRGCQLRVSFFEGSGTQPSLTRLRLSVAQREILPLPSLDQEPTPSPAAQLLEPFLARISTTGLPGTLEITPDGQHLFYEETHLCTDPTSLEALCETMADLLRIYPRLANLGGLAVPHLKSLAILKHAFQPVAIQLLHNIAQETQNRLAEQANQLLCPTCLRACTAHKLELPLIYQLHYYGCRTCGQSLEFLSVKKSVIAILDTQMTQKHISRAEVLYGNWLLHRQLFDFDQVYIRRASDEEVERFAVQVGNDTDPLQQPRYATMRCLVWSDAGLSENSLKILKRTFGRVEIETRGGPPQEKLKSSGFGVSRLGSETEEETVEDAQEI